MYLTKLFVKNALERSDRAKLMLVSQHKVPRPFRWSVLGKYKVDPRLVGIMKGAILIGIVPVNEASSLITALNDIGLNTTSQDVSLPIALESIFRSRVDLVLVSTSVLMCAVLQYFAWQLLDFRDGRALMLSFTLIIVFILILIAPKIFQRTIGVEKLWENVNSMKKSVTNTHAARTQHSVAAIFSSNAFRYFQVCLLLLACISWLFSPFFLEGTGSSVLLYLTATFILGTSTALNHRVLNHEVSWILNAEYLLIYSNIWWGPNLEIPIGEVIAFIQERGRVRIKFSSRADYSLFINGPKDALTEAIEWTNELLDIRAESLSKTTGDLKT